jgi:hypothetical protein
MLIFSALSLWQKALFKLMFIIEFKMVAGDKNIVALIEY